VICTTETNKQGTIECNQIVDSTQCLVSGLASSGASCVWVELSEDAGKCEQVASACDSITSGKIECETPGAAVSPTDGTLSCFWLYSSADGEEGGCRSKGDLNLACSNGKRSSQCVTDDVTNLNESCVWLDGNDTRSPKVEAQCKLRVCLWGLFSFGY
jgi:hypothetical protein